MTYVLLIYRADGDRKLPNADEQAALRGHRTVQAETAARGTLRAVARLDEARHARTVKRGASKAHEVLDGPFVEAKEWLVGFYLIDCASEEDAVRHAKTLAGDDHHAIEVRPVTWQWKP